MAEPPFSFLGADEDETWSTDDLDARAHTSIERGRVLRRRDRRRRGLAAGTAAMLAVAGVSALGLRSGRDDTTVVLRPPATTVAPAPDPYQGPVSTGPAISAAPDAASTTSRPTMPNATGTSRVTPTAPHRTVPSSSPTTAANLPPSPSLLYVSKLPNDQQVFYRWDEAGGLRQLSTDPALDRDLAWTPDHTAIVFSSERANATRSLKHRWDLFVADRDLGSVRQLTTSPMRGNGNTGPTVSPDGKLVAFGGDDDQGTSSLQVIGLDGSDLHTVAGTDGAFNPAWSPDGTWLAYLDDSGAELQIWVVRPDGTDRHLVRQGGVSSVDQRLAWMADGSALIAERDGTDRRALIRVDLADGRPRDLDGLADDERAPCALADGTHLVVARTPRGTTGAAGVWLQATGGAPARLLFTEPTGYASQIAC